MILQRFRIIVGDAGFEPGISAPEVYSMYTYPLLVVEGPATAGGHPPPPLAYYPA